MARMARAEVFALDEVADVHVMNRVVHRYRDTHKHVPRPFLTLAESRCIVIQRIPNKAFNADGEYAAG